MNDHFNLFPWYERIPAERVRIIIRNACIVATRYWQDKPVRLLVGNLFGEGSVQAGEICRYGKFDPNGKVKDEKKRLDV